MSCFVHSSIFVYVIMHDESFPIMAIMPCLYCHIADASAVLGKDRKPSLLAARLGIMLLYAAADLSVLSRLSFPKK